MGAVDHAHVEAGLIQPVGAVGIALHHPVDIELVHLLHEADTPRQGHGRRGDGVGRFRQHGIGVAPGVDHLRGDLRPVPVTGLRDAGETADVLVPGDIQLAGAVEAVLLVDAGGADGHQGQGDLIHDHG